MSRTTINELYLKYHIDNSHSQWDNDIDNWMSIEIYRIMHKGELPSNTDLSIKWVTDFLDKIKSDSKWWGGIISSRKDWGSLFLTAKRMVFRYTNEILNELNTQS